MILIYYRRETFGLLQFYSICLEFHKFVFAVDIPHSLLSFFGLIYSETFIFVGL